MNPIPIQVARQHQTDVSSPSRAGKVLPEGDTRWVLAARACLAAHKAAQIDPVTRERLVASGMRLGLSPIHAAAIVGIGEMAASRGGLNAADAERLAMLPEPASPGNGSARMEMFLRGTIVLLVVTAVVLFVLRWT